jgi:hypothetical protein
LLEECFERHRKKKGGVMQVGYILKVELVAMALMRGEGRKKLDREIG